MTQKQHILLILGKDLLFLLLGVFLIVKGRFFGAVVGGLMLLWYGRDFSFRIKAAGADERIPARRGTPLRAPAPG